MTGPLPASLAEPSAGGLEMLPRTSERVRPRGFTLTSGSRSANAGCSAPLEERMMAAVIQMDMDRRRAEQTERTARFIAAMRVVSPRLTSARAVGTERLGSAQHSRPYSKKQAKGPESICLLGRGNSPETVARQSKYVFADHNYDNPGQCLRQHNTAEYEIPSNLNLFTGLREFRGHKWTHRPGAAQNVAVSSASLTRVSRRRRRNREDPSRSTNTDLNHLNARNSPRIA